PGNRSRGCRHGVRLGDRVRPALHRHLGVARGVLGVDDLGPVGEKSAPEGYQVNAPSSLSSITTVALVSTSTVSSDTEGRVGWGFSMLRVTRTRLSTGDQSHT